MLFSFCAFVFISMLFVIGFYLEFNLKERNAEKSNNEKCGFGASLIGVGINRIQMYVGQYVVMVQ